MLFELKCRDCRTHDKRVFTYDNMTNTVCEDGVELDFAQRALEILGGNMHAAQRLTEHESALKFSSVSFRAKKRLTESLVDFKPQSVERFCRDHPLKGKSRRIVKLKIQLGFACNYRCSYCLQSVERQRKVKQPDVKDIKRFFAMFDSAGVILEPDALVDLWGGEPLVYMPLLRKLIPEIRRRWGNEIVLSLFTNGVLLTHEATDFLLHYRVKVNISHDGPGQGFRLSEGMHDPLEDERIRNEWLYLFEKSRTLGIPMAFFSVINPGNCDLTMLKSFFQSRFSPEVNFAFGGAASEYAGLPDAVLIGESQAECLKDTLLEVVLSEPQMWPGLMRRIFNLTGRFVHKTPASRIRYHCNAVDDHVLCVDLSGRILSCQNRAAPEYQIGHLLDYEAVKNLFFTHWSHRRQCPKCLVLGACKGGCPDLSDDEQARCCINDFAFHYAHFYAVWFLLTSTLIKEISPEPPFPMAKSVSKKGIAIHAISKGEVLQ